MTTKHVGVAPSNSADIIRKSDLDAVTNANQTAAFRTIAIPFHIQGTLTTGVKTPEFICPVSGSVTPMRGRCSAGSGVTYRLVKNGSSNMDTSSSTGTTVVSTTLSTNNTVSSGDRVQLEIVSAGTGGTDLSVTAALVISGA